MQVVGLQSQARLLHQPCIRPLQVLQTGEIGDKTEGHLQHGEVQACLSPIPAVSADTRIINRLQVMASALRNAPLSTSSNQLDAIQMLRTLFEKWKLLAPPALLNESHVECLPRASLPPAHCSLPNTTPAPNFTNNPFHAHKQNDKNNDAPGATTWLLPLLPASVPRTPVQRAHVTPFQQATPTSLVFDNVASPRVPKKTPQLPVTLPLPRVVRVTKPYRPLHKVTSCTTKTQFPHGTGAIPYSHCQNNTAK